MTLTALLAVVFRPDAAARWGRWLQDAAPATLGRTSLYCPSRRSLASLASGPSET